MLPSLREIIRRIKEICGDTILVETRYWNNTVFEYHAQEEGWETHIYCTPSQCLQVTITEKGAEINISPTMQLTITRQQQKNNTTVIIS